MLGKSPSWQDAAGACSGYLVEEGGFRLLLDCGNGVFSKLRRICDYVDVDAVVISHLHADHFLDLVPTATPSATRRASSRCRSRLAGTDDPARPELYVPSGATGVFRRIVGCWGNEDLIEKAFELHEYSAPTSYAGAAADPLLRGAALHGHLRRRAVSNGSRFTFGADCSPNEQLVQLRAGTPTC